MVRKDHIQVVYNLLKLTTKDLRGTASVYDSSVLMLKL